MDDQSELFGKNGEAYARHSDPHTSHDAAESVRGKEANRLEREILSVLQRHPHGLTNHEISEATGLPWNTTSPRIAPLVRKGLVCDTGERRKAATNRACIVWGAVKKDE